MQLTPTHLAQQYLYGLHLCIVNVQLIFKYTRFMAEIKFILPINSLHRCNIIMN